MRAATTSDHELKIEMTALHKRFRENGVTAVADVDLTIRGGAVTALVGENGAGKSTLMHLLAGTLEADSGCVTRNGERIGPSAQTRRDAGIVMSFQNPRLEDELTVVENLFLGEEPTRHGVLFDQKRARELVLRVAPEFPKRQLDHKLQRLSAGERRIVSLVAALLKLPHDRPGLLILDEPTETTTPSETERIHATVRATADAGHAVILISHKLEEVTALSDRVVVMRAGSIEAEREQPFHVEQLTGLMYGDRRDSGPRAKNRPLPRESARTRLELSRLTIAAGERRVVDDLSLSVQTGEVCALVSFQEEALEALEDVISGARPPDSGHVCLDGATCPYRLASRRTRWMRAGGLGYVPKERIGRGASLQASLAENLIARERRTLSRLGLVDRRLVTSFVREKQEAFSVSGVSQHPMSHLSGGNVQRAIVAREATENTSVLIIVEPAVALDHDARMALRRELHRLAAHGTATLVLTNDVDDAAFFATRLVGVAGGALVADGTVAELSPDQLHAILSRGRAAATTGGAS